MRGMSCIMLKDDVVRMAYCFVFQGARETDKILNK